MTVDIQPTLNKANHWPERESILKGSRERRRLQLYVSMMMLDSLAIMVGFAIGNLIRFNDPFGMPNSPSMALLLLPVFLCIALANRSYSIDALTNWRFGAGRVLTALGCAAGGVIFLAFFLKAGADFSRLAFVYGATASVLTLGATRRLFEMLVVRRGRSEIFSIMVICDGAAEPDLPGARIVDAAAAELRPDINEPLSLDRLGRFLRGIDRVVIACAPDRRDDWAMALKGAHVGGEILDEDVAQLGAIGTRRYGDQAALIVSAGALGLRDRVFKRLLDLGLALVAIILLSPLLIITAVAVKLSDRGPVLFAQERLGRGNQLFRILKFRSMRVADCDNAGNLSTARDDNRVTRIGRFIRGTSIDELPQLFNILVGDMSFVGPRPHALGSLAGDKLFWQVDARYWHRHNAKPGLTGLAQIRGFRGATHEQSDLVNRLQADLEYVNGWTLWRDVRILVATFRVLIHRNAF